MKIDSYSFGKMSVDGREFREDVILLEERIIDHWWRDQGHYLKIKDFKDYLEPAPEILVIGNGAYGVMKVPEDTVSAIENRGIECRVLKTGAAVLEYNKLCNEGKKVYGAFHLTC